MILQYCLTENDYLQWTLYSTGKSKRMRQRRLLATIMMPVIFLLLAFTTKEIFLRYYYLGVGFVLSVLYPFYQRYYYKKQLERRVAEIHRRNPFESSKLEFRSDQLEITGENEEAKFKYNTFDSIIQTGNSYFLKVKNGGALIIPKREIPDLNAFDNLMNSIAERFQLEKSNEPDWKWK